MKTQNKGFIVPVIIGVIALLLAGGTYFVVHKKANLSPQDAHGVAQQTQLNIEVFMPQEVLVDGTVTIKGKGFRKDLSRVQFSKTNQPDNWLTPFAVSEDGTLLRFTIDQNFFTKSLQSKAGVYQVSVVNTDCGNGNDVKCLVNEKSNFLNLTIKTADTSLNSKKSGGNNLQYKISVTSPKGGEQWEINSVHEISWKITGDTQPSTKVDLYLVSLQPCPAHRADGTIVGCLPADTLATLAKNIPAGTPFAWKVGGNISGNTYTGSLPNQVSLIEIKVCIAGTSTCGYSDSGFTMIPQGYGANKPPVITSLTGPTTVSVGQMVSYSINAYDPEGGKISYSTYWEKGSLATHDLVGGGLWQNPETNSPSIAFPYRGRYTVGTIVTDNVGKNTTADLTVDVQ